jgi:hypothetical protein
LARAFGNPAGISYLLLTGWMILAVPFSVYRRGCVDTLTQYWLPSLLLFLGVAGAIREIKEIRWAFYGIAAGVSMIVLMAFVRRVDLGGRLAISDFGLGNSNYIALHILYGLPFLFFMAIHSGAFSWQRLAAFGAILAACWAVILTGSRGGFVGIILGMVILLWFLPYEAKAKMVGVGTIVLLLTVPLVPEHIRTRYLTVFSDEHAEEDGQDSAVASAEQRRSHLRDSIRITFEKPLFGTGLGQYIVGSSREAEEAGRLAQWRETHNAYTQVSSETGIPGFLFYMFPIVYALKKLRCLIRKLAAEPALREIWLMGLCLAVSWACIMVTAFFASIAYQQYFPVLVGLTLVFTTAAEAELKKVSPAPATGPVFQARRMPAPIPPKLPTGRRGLTETTSPNVRNRRFRNTPSR